MIQAGRARQPNYPVGVNFSHPLARGMIAAIVGSMPIELVERRAAVWAAPTTRTYTSMGKRGRNHLLSTSSLTDALIVLDTSRTPRLPTGDCTMIMHYRKTDGTARNTAGAGVLTSTNADRLGVHLPFGDGTVYWDYGGASGNNRTTVAGATFGDDVWAFTAGAHGMEIWQNGVLLASKATAITRANGVSEQFGYGMHGASALADNAESAFLYLYGRRLSKAEIASIGTNPYQMLGRPARRLWVKVGGFQAAWARRANTVLGAGATL